MSPQRSLFVTATTIALTAIVAVAAACSSDDAPADNSGTTATSAVPTVVRTVTRVRTGPVLELANGGNWINSVPLTIGEQIDQNKVVLVDFWTYTCVNCIRTIPFLREWYDKYSGRGLVIIGVHTPEFEFEKDAANVERAAMELGVEWPIAQDNDYNTWNKFGNRYWPAKYLIGVDGELAYTHFGEGSYVETEEKIREALTAAGHDVTDIPIGSVNNVKRDEAATAITRELYGGYDRNLSLGGGYAAQDAYYLNQDKTFEYVDEGFRAADKFYLQGPWRAEREAVVHARETTSPEDYLALKVAATSVNVVIEPDGPEPFDVFVEISDAPLTADQAGEDIMFDSQGRSYFTVTDARLYAIVRLPEFAISEMKLSSTSDNFAIFAFTFGINESGI